MRPLVMNYEDDENTYNLNDEYMVGDSILVAPVVAAGERVKKVYLPKGDWYRLTGGEKISGGRYILEEAPLDYLPVFIKAGSVIPTYEDIAYVGEREIKKLTLLATPEGGKAAHYRDNGEDYAYLDGEYDLYELEVSKEGKLKVNMANSSERIAKYEEIAVSIL